MYDEKERQIFTYFNGEKQVKGDPLAIHRKLFVTAKKDGYDLDVIRNNLQLAALAYEAEAKRFENDPNLTPDQNTGLSYVKYDEDMATFLPYIRTAFVVKPFEDGGLTEAELLTLLNEFILFMGGLQKKTESLAPGLEPTSVCPEVENSPTRSSLEPTSTEIESSCWVAL